MKTTDIATHTFELAGLGKAPFRCVGRTELKFQAAPGEPVRAGGSCDYCGTAICDAFLIRSADGRRFKVGSSCIRKTGDRGLVKHADDARREKDRARRAAKAKADHAELTALLADTATRARLATFPHPSAWRADKGETFADQCAWMLKNAGAKGRGETLRAIRTRLARV